MAIIDKQNQLSADTPGDVPTATGDTASANVIDQGAGGAFLGGRGGAYVAPFVVVQVTAAGTSLGSATLQIVVQDSANNSSFADVILGDVIAVADLLINTVAFARRLLPSMRRYIRLVYRIGVADLVTGKFFAFLTLDQDVIDLSMRQATGYVTEPSGALDESN